MGDWKPERWGDIEGFPEYAVSELGYVIHLRRRVPRKNSVNKEGHVKVTLYQEDGKLQTRSVATLVAKAFVSCPEERFDTVIHLDGDLQNCEADNLLWRPRWYAIRYHRQFDNPNFHHGNTKLYEIETDTYYDSVKEACVANGLYFQDVIRSFIEETFVPITYQEFRLLKE